MRFASRERALIQMIAERFRQMLALSSPVLEQVSMSAAVFFTTWAFLDRLPGSNN